MSRRVALDAMGGDAAPEATVAGALRAAAAGVDVVLVGAGRLLGEQLVALGQPRGLPVVDAPEAVGMGEDPAIALRAKPRASVRTAAELVAAGEAGALVSAGSTGATLAAALLTLGRVPGVRRPALAVVLPARGGREVVLVDAGGSADAQPEAVAASARMAVAYAQARGVDRPLVGLLNVGAEKGKGNALAKVAHTLLERSERFAGNVEPAAVLGGAVDVVVTDGFTGNIFLKTLEAVAGRDARDRGVDGAAAVLLGVRGAVLVAHGDAGPDEIAQALRQAVGVACAGLPRLVARRLQELAAPPTAAPVHGDGADAVVVAEDGVE